MAPALGLCRARPALVPDYQVQRLASVQVCNASYFPHHRVHLTHRGAPIPQQLSVTGTWQHRAQQLAPEPATYPPEQLADLLNPQKWQLYAACSTLIEDVQARFQALSAVMVEAFARANALWQHVVLSWPAWSASLREDVEYVIEYALGVLPAWLATMQAALQAAYDDVRATAAVQHIASTASTAVKDAVANMHKLRQAVAETNQSATYRFAESPPLQQLMRLASSAVSKDSSSATSNVARGLTHSMAALTAAELAASAPSSKGRFWERNKGSNSKAELDTVDCRLSLVGFSTAAYGEGGRLSSGQAAASSGLRHIVVEPLQQAGFISSCGRSPTLAGMIAAASVLMAASIYRSFQRRAQEAEERMLQQVQLQMNAEALAAQRARFRRALDDSQAASGGAPAVSIATRRRAPSPADVDAWEETAAPLSSPIMPAGQPSAAAGPHAILPELDASAAQEYARFMAGARAMDVPMWDSHMVQDWPQVSIKELQRQTQKIRAAATDEERAAMEDTEQRRAMVEQQLNSQLAELSGAPIGRAAREAWRKEQQQRKQQEQEQREHDQQQGRCSVGDEGAGSSRAGSRTESNPFAISSAARAQWEAEDHLYSDTTQKAKKGGSGWGFGMGSKSQQQQQHQQPTPRRRRFSDEPTPETAAAQPPRRMTNNDSSSSSSSNGSSSPANPFLAGLAPAQQQPKQQQQSQVQSVQQPKQQEQQEQKAAPAEGSPEWEAMRDEMMRSGAARRARRQQMMMQQQGAGDAAGARDMPTVSAPAATAPASGIVPAADAPADSSPAASAPAGSAAAASAPSGSAPAAAPAALSAAAAAAASQKQVPQGSSSGAAAGLHGKRLLERSLHRPTWPGSNANGGAAASASSSCNSSEGRFTVLGWEELEQQQQQQMLGANVAGSSSGSSKLAQVSAKDAEGITAPVAAPRHGDMERMQAAAAASAEAAAEAKAAAAAGAAGQDTARAAAASPVAGGSVQVTMEREERNPFAVDAEAVIDDDTAFEIGQLVDKEAKRIRLQF